MQKLFYILIVISLIALIALFVLGAISKKGQALGLKDGQLQACTSNDNCVISESIEGRSATIQPYSFNGNEGQFLIKLESVVKTMGGNIVSNNQSYLAVTFTSPVFGFVDDLELRIAKDHQLHFRSSSRVGRKDFGANKKRIDEMKALLAE